MSDGNNVVIQVHRLVSGFGTALLHDHLDLEVYRGEVLGVVGASGTGKSILLRTIIGLVRPCGGTIQVFGKPIDCPERGRMRTIEKRWGILFQEGALFSSQTVAENIQVPLREHTSMPQHLMNEIAALKIAMVGLPADSATKYPSQLSGGMRKRAALARALALDPELLFLDEPTAGLDPISAGQFDDLLLRLRESFGLTVFMVTHDVDSLRTICDRVAVLVGGTIKIGTIEELQADPTPWIHAYFCGPRGHAALAH